MSASDDLRIGQLLCTRLCHDLSGPIGALVAGLEMAAEPARREEIVPLLSETGDDLMRRFAFYRLAFGLRGGDHGTATLSEAAELADGLTRGTRSRVHCRFDGTDPDRARPAAMIRCLLCLILVGLGAAPRGGLIQVDASVSGPGLILDLDVTGEGIRLDPTIRAILAGTGKRAAVDARTVHAALAVRLADSIGALLTVAPGTPGCLHLGVESRPYEPRALGRR